MENMILKLNDQQKEKIKQFKKNFNQTNSKLTGDKIKIELEFPYFFPIFLIGTKINILEQQNKDEELGYVEFKLREFGV